MFILLSIVFLSFTSSVFAEKDPAFLFEGKASPNFFDIQKEFYATYGNTVKKTDQPLERDSYNEGMLYQFRKK